jgi:iron complex outermembrane receptor protein
MRIGLNSSALTALFLAVATPVVAQAQTPAIRFSVPAGPLQTALPLFAVQSGEQILYSTNLTVGRQSPGVSGAMRTDDALAALLEGTGLRPTPSSCSIRRRGQTLRTKRRSWPRWSSPAV